MSGDDLRRIWLCADDYGLSPGVNRAIRELIARRRLNATSVMVVGPAAGEGETAALQEAAAKNPPCAIGLHVTLSAPFHPLTMHFRPLEGGLFPPFAKLLRAAMLRRLDAEIVRTEVSAQLAAFAEKFRRAPDFVDGHQHVQLFPLVRDGFLAAVKQAAPDAWVRQGGRAQPIARRLRSPKALLLDILSVQFRHSAARANIAFNPAFAGAYDFSNSSDFSTLMPQFIDGLPDGGLIMCHPGFVDDTLKRLDPLTDQREREYAYLGSDAFAQLLTANNVALARPPVVL